MSVKKKLYNIAVAGATGVVGKEILSILEERKFPVGEIRLLASERSAGEKIRFRGKDETVRLLEKETFEGIDIGLFSPGASVSASTPQKPQRQDALSLITRLTSGWTPDVPSWCLR